MLRVCNETASPPKGYEKKGESENKNKNGLFQWGHGFSSMDTGNWAIRQCFTYKLQWGHGFSSMDTEQMASKYIGLAEGFNGAMDFHPWIDGDQGRWLNSEPASMGPWTFIHR